MSLTLTKAAIGSMLLAGAAAALAQVPAWMPKFEPDGTVRVPAFDLPPSPFMSKEALEVLKARATIPDTTADAVAPTSIDQMRRATEMSHAPQLEAMKARYPTNTVEQRIAGVRVRVVTPKGGKVDPKRVLIQLHGGFFNRCAEACAMEGSIPIAAIGGFKVITVDYRMAPEYVFPAASEDIEKVYRELLKTYKPKQIGIYGCSAGGQLAASAAAWLPAHGLPQAGAIGIFGASAWRLPGDSAWISASVDGRAPPPPKPGTPLPPPGPIRDYFEGAKMDDPIISPALHPDILAKFPPTLVITGTRAQEMSAAVVTHSKLVDAAVPGDLIVGEGMGHCYIETQHQLPEAQAAYRAIVRFFKMYLG